MSLYNLYINNIIKLQNHILHLFCLNIYYNSLEINMNTTIFLLEPLKTILCLVTQRVIPFL